MPDNATDEQALSDRAAPDLSSDLASDVSSDGAPDKETADNTAPRADAPEEDAPDPQTMTTEEIWERLKTRISSKSKVLGACLADGTLRYEPPDRVFIEIDSSNPNVNLLNRKKNIAGIEKHCNDFFKKPITVSIDITSNAPDSAEVKKNHQQLENEARAHPVVDAAVKTFNGKIRDIKIL